MGREPLVAPFAFRVAWFDCDPAGIVFYPRVLAYMNEAAHAYLEQAGFPLERLAERNIVGVPIVSLSVNYRRALRLGDRARIETNVTGIGKSSIRFSHRVLVGEGEAVEASEVRVYSVKTHDGGIAAASVHDDVRAALLGAGGEKAA